MFFSGDLIPELCDRQGGRCCGKMDGTCFAAGHLLVLCGPMFQSQPQRVPGRRADGYKERLGVCVYTVYLDFVFVTKLRSLVLRDSISMRFTRSSC